MVNYQDIVIEIEKRVASKLINVDAGHDMWHICRVRNNAAAIQRIEGGDLFIIELAVLLHDVVDEKYFDTNRALDEIKSWFIEFEIDNPIATEVIQIITYLSFSKELDGIHYNSLEFRIVQDADRLDAIGAIGIARAFSYGNQHQRPFFDPDALPAIIDSKDQYRKSNSATLNHFFEKLIKIKGMMKTETGKQMAAERHRFMIQYLNQFIDESLSEEDNVINRWRELIEVYGE